MKVISVLYFFFLSAFLFSQNQPPVVTATGNQPYCPSSQIPIVETFSITDVDNTTISAFYIQISTGYENNVDQLVLRGNHPLIDDDWSAVEGKLTLKAKDGGEMLLIDLENAVKDIVYQSTNGITVNAKSFSLTAGNANFLPTTQHYYEYVPDIGVRWDEAKNLAEARTYFGLQGYLATVTSTEEAQITGEQALGAGWIGGSDQEEEGVWKWVTGPEVGTVFWNGTANGSTPNFAFWNTGEPNQFQGREEDYAHITDPSVGILGAWNDLTITGDPSGSFQPKGYMVEYGGLPTDPVLQIAASTQIYIPEITAFSGGTVCNTGSVTLTASASNGGTVYWFDSPLGGNLKATGTPFITPVLNNTTTYYISPFSTNCTSVARQAVTATVLQNPTITSTESALICTQGSATISATTSAETINWYSTPTSTVPLFTGAIFTTNVTETTLFYAEAVNNNCKSERVPVSVTIDNTQPQFNVITNAVLCLNDDFIEITATNISNNTATFEWEDASGTVVSTSKNIKITQPGNYFVTATSVAGCISDSKTVSITASERANTAVENFIISDETTNNSIRVISENLGAGSYSYSLNNPNGNYNSQTYFENLAVGAHTLYIKDNNGCGTAQFDFVVLNYPNFITPNGDGNKDVWQLEGYREELFTITKVFIFDRYGKVLKELDPANLIWNGTYNGAIMPSANYWFHITLTTNNGRTLQRKESFALLRR